MKTDSSLKLLSEVRDLQLVDSEGLNCGICDDIEFHGKPGEPLVVSALVVGPGAYGDRLPGWAARMIAIIAGRSVIHVPWKSIEEIDGRIHLSQPASSLGLRKTENRLIRAFRKIPFS